jgi:hypothetical protein
MTHSSSIVKLKNEDKIRFVVLTLVKWKPLNVITG